MTTIIVLSVIPCAVLAVLTVMLLKPATAKVRVRSDPK